ncbi:unnamed protein product [Menidia menidia]|uniref:(Atlantic silverside) hypothetical protein n=1 Tax=Menidia menidia TaxID=238744 RepID=A0A8S4BBP6_9TELE|nr:unnamed protein product [Menidia menidia]
MTERQTDEDHTAVLKTEHLFMKACRFCLNTDGVPSVAGWLGESLSPALAISRIISGIINPTLGSSPACRLSSAASVQACLTRAVRATADKSRAGVNGRAPEGRSWLQTKPEGKRHQAESDTKG